MNLSELRTALWHLRKGGFRQLGRHLEHRENLRLKASQDAADKQRVEEMKRAELRGFDPLDFEEFPENTSRPKPFGHYRVGAILDDFSHLAWGGEFDLVPLSPESWREEIAEGIDFLLVESAWQGNSGAWRYQVVGSNAPSDNLRELVAHCRASGIPTVFWNKEDPAHFDDFLASAELFEVVATTDAACAPRYQAALPGSRVVVAPFAAQPRVHNPIRTAVSGRYQRGDLCFAGTYFRHKFPGRARQMEFILRAGLRASDNLHSALTIYSRNQDVDDKYTFPAPFDEWVVGALPYGRMLSAYRGYKVFLNVNTVTDSPTMFSRRVVELLAAGTAVATTPAEGISRLFGPSEVLTIDGPAEQPGEEAEAAIDAAAASIEAVVRSPLARDRMVHKAQRIIWEGHTYTHRAEQIVQAVGLPAANGWTGRPKATVIMATNRPERVTGALAQIVAQREIELEILVGLHGIAAPEQAPAGVLFREFPAEASLGEVLNGLVGEASGDYVAKMDDDDCYGPDYLRDQVNALRYSGAEVVGKQASYLYLADTDELVLRKPWREHLWTDLVLGATLTGRRETFVDHPFRELGRGEDTQFLRDVAAAGGRIYSADRFNYIQVRAAHGHTWDVEASALKRNGIVESYGLNRDHVFVGRGADED